MQRKSSANASACEASLPVRPSNATKPGTVIRARFRRIGQLVSHPSNFQSYRRGPETRRRLGAVQLGRWFPAKPVGDPSSEEIAGDQTQQSWVSLGIRFTPRGILIWTECSWRRGARVFAGIKSGAGWHFPSHGALFVAKETWHRSKKVHASQKDACAEALALNPRPFSLIVSYRQPVTADCLSQTWPKPLSGGSDRKLSYSKRKSACRL